MVNGMRRIAMNAGMNRMLITSVMALAVYRLEISPHTKSLCSMNSIGPGRSPQMIMPPSSTAVVGEPGMPRVSMGSMEPVLAALLAASGAATPAGSPAPNLWGWRLMLLATP